LDIVWSCNIVKKEVVFLGVTCCLKFTEEACVLLLGEFVFAVVEFLRSQQADFMSNLCWNPWRGVEKIDRLREVKGDSIPCVV
jgi:hypothetical protein